MQNNKTLKEEIKRNSNTVFMSEALDGLLSFDPIKSKNNIECKVITTNNSIVFDLNSKETIDNFFFVAFYCSVDSILLLEKEDIESIKIIFSNEEIKTFNNDEYSYNLSWKQENNKYLADIFINKKGG